MSAAVPHPPSGLPDRLGLILAGLRRDLAVRAARDRALAALLLVFWNRLSRTLARFSSLLARHQAGRLRTPHKPRRRSASATPPPRDPLPRHFGWLVRRVPECAVHGEYLRLLLDDPEMAALLAELPQARSLLRPLWRMLRTEKVPFALRPEPVPEQPPRHDPPRPPPPAVAPPRTVSLARPPAPRRITRRCTKLA